MTNKESVQLIIVGLGYVGLPLAIEFSRKYKIIGLDIDKERIDELNNNFDRTLEVSTEDLNLLENLEFTTTLENCKFSDKLRKVFIVTVPTPIDDYKNPDLNPLIKASEMVGSFLGKDDIVIYESTVFPGCTEEVCVPILESVSGKIYNSDFFVGYSPERINPGDKINTLTNILKVTSGSTEEIAEFIDQLYKSIITAGTFKAESIKVAEAAKLIENCQRDINISFVNELALIFDRIGISTQSVLEAARTKWNFLNFKPGLVGGHCIGVDPYYMIHKAEQLGYYPEVIGAGRRINDNMGVFVANKVVKLMIKNELPIKKSKSLILGFTFKENCPDIRNTRVIDIYNELVSFGIDVDVYDPWANPIEVKKKYGIDLLSEIKTKYHSIVLCVSHSEFAALEIPKMPNGIVYDVKGFWESNRVDGKL